MSLISEVMKVYPYVFHPAVVLGLGALLTIHWEWARSSPGRSELLRRVGAFLGAGVLSLVPAASAAHRG